MHGISIYIYHTFKANAGKYSIQLKFLEKKDSRKHKPPSLMIISLGVITNLAESITIVYVILFIPTAHGQHPAQLGIVE